MTDKAKAQLEKELSELRRANAELKAIASRCQQIEAELREKDSIFRAVADFTYDLEYWLKPDGDFIYISPSCKRITGYSPEEFKKNPELLEKIVHPDDRAVFNCSTSAALGHIHS